jgi:transcription antitermination factor NusG
MSELSETFAMYVVARVISRQEKAFAEHVQDSYIPMLEAQTRARRKREMVTVHRPAFPGYVFVNLTPGTFARSRGHNSFLGFIMNGPDIAVLANSIVDELKTREKAQEFNFSLKIGDEVIINPFNDLNGTIEHIDLRTGRARVNAYGRVIIVDMSSLQRS